MIMKMNNKCVAVLAMTAILLVSCNGQQTSSSSQTDSRVASYAQGPIPTPVTLFVPTFIEPSSKISPDLASQMKINKGEIGFLMLLTSQARIGVNTTNMGQGDYAYSKEKDVANQTQPAVESAIIELKKQGEISDYYSYTIVNGFYVKGTAKAIIALASRSDVKLLELDYTADSPDEQYWRNKPVVTPTTGIPSSLKPSEIMGQTLRYSLSKSSNLGDKPDEEVDNHNPHWPDADATGDNARRREH